MNFPNTLTLPLRSKSIAAINHDIDDELEFHIQSRIDELIAGGVLPAQAEIQSRTAFGSRDQIRKQCQRINYGNQVRLIILSFAGLAASVVAICWLSYQLMTLKNQNATLAKQLMSAASASAGPALIAAPESIAQDKHDLFGTVAGPDGNPIADAKVMLIFKSWPGGQYRQNALATTTDIKGNYRFKNLYSTNMQTAFLVSVVTDGYVLSSKYWVNDKRAEIKAVKMRLKKATLKTLTLLQKDGEPLANTKVFPQSRNIPTDGRSGGETIYQQSAGEVMLSTDDEGKVKMNYFVAKDNAVIGVMMDGEIVNVQFKVDDTPDQTIGGTIGGKPLAGAEKQGKADVSGTVSGEDGNAIAGAMVLLIHKRWPNGRYRQDVYKAKTDNNGSFVFPKRYRLGEQYGFLVSIVADGWAMSSEYVLDEEGDELDPFIFDLEKATAKTFVFQDKNGKALKRLAVYPSSRKTENDEEFMIYNDSGKDVDVKTDSNGKVKFNCFVAGDTATFGFLRGGSLEVKVTDDAEQIVTIKKK